MTPGSPTPAALRRVLARAVALPPVLLGLLALVFLGQVAYLMATVGRVEHTNRVLADAHALRRLIVDQETGARGYVLTGDPAFLAPAHAAEAQTGPAFEGLAGLVADHPAQAERLAALRADHAGWWAFMEHLVEVARGGGDAWAVARTGEGNRRMDAMRARFAEFVRVEEGLREERTRAARAATWAVSGVSLALALLLGGVLAVRTRGLLLGVVRSYSAALDQQAELRDQLRQHAADLERRVEDRTRELRESLARVKQLQGLLPICGWCKRVRDDGDYWHQVEHYVAAHSEARFTHGMCPDCEARQMAELGEEGDRRRP